VGQRVLRDSAIEYGDQHAVIGLDDLIAVRP